MGRKKSQLADMLKSAQGKAAKVTTGAYKGTSLQALDVEAFLIPIDHVLEQLALKAMVRLQSTPAYETVAKIRLGLSKRSKEAASRKKPPLELLEDIYTSRYGSLDNIEKLVPIIVMPDWIPPPTDILPRRQAVKEWKRICAKGEGMIYTDGSGINNKIGAAMVCGDTTVMRYMGSSLFFTVYSAELLGILMAMSYIKAIYCHPRQTISVFHIFVDNQAAITTIRDPGMGSGQAIVGMIIQTLDDIRARGITVMLHWIPAHENHEGNERADAAAKKATGLKTARRRGKVIERDSDKTARRFDLGFYLTAPLKLKMKQEADERWHDEWKKEVKGKALRRVAPIPSKQILKLHRGLHREVSSVLTQIRTEKIGLRAYLFDRHVPGIDDACCECGSPRQTARHILEECRLHRSARERHWFKELADKRVGILTANKMLTRYPQKAVAFMWKTGLIRRWCPKGVETDG